MMEKIKTILLALLVAFSLLQSYLLAYSTPNFESINPTEYIETEQIGKKMEVENLVFPEQVILHFGDKTHTVLYPDNYFYNMIFTTLKDRVFDGLSQMNPWNKSELDDFRDHYTGVEIRFRQAIPLSVLQSILQIKGGSMYEDDRIGSIWVMTKAKQEEVKAFFIADRSKAVYEVVSSNLTEKDVERLVGLGEYMVRYQPANKDYYLPDQDLAMFSYHLSYETITPEQMEKSLFVDPGITRNLRERDGTEIYTDGKRGLQIKREQQWMSYSDPVAPAEGESDPRDDVYTSIQFINQHGGWNGKYRLSGISERLSNEGQEITFRQYVDSYPESFPIIETNSMHFGYIKIVLQKGIVSDYERSLINFDLSKAVKEEMVLPGGKALQKRLELYAKKYSVQQVFPAYQARLVGDGMEFIPVWAVELSNGDYEFLP